MRPVPDASSLGPIEDQAGTITLPIGHSAMPASFRCSQAKGRTWPSASQQPAIKATDRSASAAIVFDGFRPIARGTMAPSKT